MASSDYKLGLRVHEHLKRLGIETPMRPEHLSSASQGEHSSCDHDHGHRLNDKNFASSVTAFHVLTSNLGLDLEDDSIRDTPKRLAKMYHDEICWGLDYTKFPKCTTVDNKFNYDELIIIRDIEVKSLCEHHFMPIMGKATIAYIPSTASTIATSTTKISRFTGKRLKNPTRSGTQNSLGKVMGLSKFNRVVEFFSRRPQVQERLTEQISAALQLILETNDVAVIIAADHYCVKFRGIEDICSDTVTSKMSGRFRDPNKPELRAELMALINHRK